MRLENIFLTATLSFAMTGCGGSSDDVTETEAPAETTAVAPETPADETEAAAANRLTVSEGVNTTPSARRAPQTTPSTADRGIGVVSELAWSPTDTGTVNPGMTREQVIDVWGDPLQETMAGDYGYLYYRNGCEHSCGTFDVVFLDGGQVVDAVVRGRGHNYSGMSSSPTPNQPVFTPPASENGMDEEAGEAS